MYLQVRFLRKPLVTHLTCKWLLSSMWSIMYIKEWTAAKWLLAYVTFIWLLYWFHWWVLSSISILSCANGWIITKRQTSKFISCNFFKNVDKNQTIKHTAQPSSIIAKIYYFRSSFLRWKIQYACVSLPHYGQQYVSLTSCQISLSCTSGTMKPMQNTCICLEQNFSQRWTGHPYSHWTLPYDYFLLCTTHRQNTVQEENYRILTKWKGILLAHLRNLGKRSCQES